MTAPYRVLFPLGFAFAVAAALVWPLHGAGRIAYPAALHWTLMVQGFLHCFVLGFLLTAMPAFLHAEKTRPWETALAAGAMAAFAALEIAAFAAGPPGARLRVLSQLAYVTSVMVVIQAGARRFPRRRDDPPEEFLFVGLGIVLAAAAALLAIAAGAGLVDEPAPRFTLHLLTNGTMLSIVLGLGGLLVPTFSAMREPLSIPGLARPGERRPRRRLYVPLALALISALALDAARQPAAAAWLRLAPATVMALLVWKLHRRPGRRDVLSWTIWSSGWLLTAGLWIAAVVPARAILGYHVAFLGGFGLLILGVATRVVVSHGGFPMAEEKQVLGSLPVGAIGLALLARVGAEFAPSSANLHYSLSGILWTAAWLAWAWRALPRIARARPTPSPSRVPLVVARGR